VLIECNSLYGGIKSVPKEKLVLRPAACALIMRGATVLLLNTRSTGKYQLPGGGVETGERIEDALRREVREETGIEVEVERFLGFKEDFFYYDPWDEAYHSLLFFYACRPITFDLARDEQIEDGEAEKPQWITAESLWAEDFQSHGDRILAFLRPQQ